MNTERPKTSDDTSSLKWTAWGMIALLEIVSLFLIVLWARRMGWKATPRAVFTIVTLSFVLYTAALVAVYVYFRSNVDDRPFGRRTGRTLIGVGISWLVIGVFAMVSNTESFFLGMFSIVGMWVWLPLSVMGWVLLGASSGPSVE